MNDYARCATARHVIARERPPGQDPGQGTFAQRLPWVFRPFDEFSQIASVFFTGGWAKDVPVVPVSGLCLRIGTFGGSVSAVSTPLMYSEISPQCFLWIHDICTLFAPLQIWWLKKFKTFVFSRTTRKHFHVSTICRELIILYHRIW